MSARIRPQRVADLLRGEISDIFMRDVRDPRVKLLSVNAVEVSNDLQHAKVYVGSIDPEAEIAEALEVLTKARGFIRMQLGRRRLGLRYIPDLRFVADESVTRGNRIDEILRQLNEEEEDSE